MSETDVGAELTVDHFQPRSKGGLDSAENWVYSCHACNEFKGDYWPAPGGEPLLHPGRDPIQEHLRERTDGVLEALTERGEFHLSRLHLNRSALVAYRRERAAVAMARAEQADLVARLARLEHEVQNLMKRLEVMDQDTSE